MTLTFENEQDFDLGFDPEEVAAAVINGVLDQEACPYEAEVELILTDPENIRTMNREHRNIDRETDVLSFPMVDYPSPASFDFLETEEGDDCFNPDSGELMLGDIVISVARASSNCWLNWVNISRLKIWVRRFTTRLNYMNSACT